MSTKEEKEVKKEDVSQENELLNEKDTETLQGGGASQKNLSSDEQAEGILGTSGCCNF